MFLIDSWHTQNQASVEALSVIGHVRAYPNVVYKSIIMRPRTFLSKEQLLNKITKKAPPLDRDPICARPLGPSLV